MTIAVTSSVLLRLRREAQDARPGECCGLLLGTGTLIDSAVPAANVAQDPLRHFEIDPQALIDAHRAERAGGPPIAGYYHSHPGGPAAPSATDRAQAAGDGRIWAIVGEFEAGEPRITLWRDEAGGFAPLFYRVVEG